MNNMQQLLKSNKLLLKQNEELIKENQLFKKSIDNENHINKVMKFIKIVYGLLNINHLPNDDNIIIYGSLFNNFFSKKSLIDTKLHFFFNRVTTYNISQIIERLNEMDFILNEDYMLLKQQYVNKNEELQIATFWELKVKINELSLDFIFHETDYMEDILFNNQNLILTKSGFTIREYTENDKIYKNKHNSMAIFNIMNNLIHNKVEINKFETNFQVFENKYNIMELLHKQNEYIKNDYVIKRGYKNNDDKDEKCCICYEEHKENDTYLYKLDCTHTLCSGCLYKHTFNITFNNHLKCPLCRQDIKLKTV